jgi:hypothetical protein
LIWQTWQQVYVYVPYISIASSAFFLKHEILVFFLSWCFCAFLSSQQGEFKSQKHCDLRLKMIKQSPDMWGGLGGAETTRGRRLVLNTQGCPGNASPKPKSGHGPMSFCFYKQNRGFFSCFFLFFFRKFILSCFLSKT